MISLFELPTANIVSGMYRMDAFDGQLNISHAGWDNYWFSVVRRDRSINMMTRAGAKWENWNGRTYNVDGHLRLDLLGIANVRFLLSGLPLEGEGLKPVVVPAGEDQAKRRPDSYESQKEYMTFRLRRIFDPGELYIYELPRYLPRVFAAMRVERIDGKADGAALHERVAATAFNGTVVLSKDDARKFDGLGMMRSSLIPVSLVAPWAPMTQSDPSSSIFTKGVPRPPLAPVINILAPGSTRGIQPGREKGVIGHVSFIRLIGLISKQQSGHLFPEQGAAVANLDGLRAGRHGNGHLHGVGGASSPAAFMNGGTKRLIRIWPNGPIWCRSSAAATPMKRRR